MADTIKDGRSSTRPPLLEGTNYPYWKARMTTYIKSIDEDAWLTVLEGWSRPTIEFEGKTLVKPQKNWTDEEKKSSNLNSKTLNAIFCGVSLKVFSRMSAITSAKEAWESLEIHYKGTVSVRIAKLQQLMTKFELIKMKEDETILEYDGKIRRLANEARLLGDPFPENRLVRKVLRSLNKKFSVKAIVIAEANNIDKMTLNEVIGSLCTFESEMETEENASPANGQNIAFTGETKKPGQSSNELLEEQIANLSKGFNKLYKKFSKRGNPSKYGEKKAEKFSAEQKRIQCHGCDGYGHIQAECPIIQKKKKAHNVTWSDSDSNSSDTEENYTVFYAGVQEDVPSPEIPEDDFTLLKVFVKEGSSKRQTVVVKEGPQVKRTHKRFKRSGRYYCQDLGHIQSQCYKLFRDLKYCSKWFQRNHLKHKFVWIRKKVSCNHALKAVTNSVWYFDSGCSRHMTGKSDLLNNISYTESGQVTFGDGGKGTITGKGTLNVDGLPRLKNVLLVQGLKANLFSISQLCDENLHVHFTSEKCLVADHKSNLVMEGVLAGDNCYKLTEKLQCYTASSDSVDIWHKKLGHVHFRHIQKLIKHAAVKGLPKIKNIRDKFCGDYQRGKQ
ncbi:hypothetical protein H6P81_011316 [Aristolochia fimbriata]|uniref:CCHC-type domain-containing protein n=1 Tax=Aristolochia fimbriata TaxID=158543 RepID=A0AAV7EUN0_ARIFI|nr:hypothetical protein H6P81_011316 [Aristolochia fimbriata]